MANGSYCESKRNDKNQRGGKRIGENREAGGGEMTEREYERKLIIDREKYKKFFAGSEKKALTFEALHGV